MLSSKSFQEELIMEILSWVPIKSLIRFRCVSKTWLKLLTVDPHFIKLHVNHLIKSNPNPSILFLHSRLDSPAENETYAYAYVKTHSYISEAFKSFHKAIELDVPFNYPSSDGGFEVVGSCNGLLCLTKCKFLCWTNGFNEFYSNLFVWNPLTRDHIIIPCSPFPSCMNKGESFFRFGFGFHHATQEYKVIRVVYNAYVDVSSHVSVYTFSTGSWRSFECSLGTYGLKNKYGIKHISKESGNILVNGALHFLAISMSMSNIYDVILSFDVKNEVFQGISPPNGLVSYDVDDARLGEFGGLLYMSFTLKDVGIDVWIMQEYGVADSWTKQFKINLPSFKRSLKLIGVANNGDTVLEKDDTVYVGLNFQKCTTLVSYNLKTNSRRRLKKPWFEYDHACVFVGSLVSPRLINGVRSTTVTGES